MSKMIVKAGIAFVFAAGLGMSGIAIAAPQANDTTLSGAFFNGSGNPNNNFAVDTETLGGGTIELGLRARYRGGPNVTPTGAGTGPDTTYTFPTGTGSGGRALWNYDFSINLDSSTYHLSDFISIANGGTGLLKASLTVSSANGLGPATIDPVIYWADSATYDGSTVYQNGSGYGSAGSMIAIQNSENLQFADSPLPGFGPWNGDEYTFTLTVATNDEAATELASVTMDVNAVPEPASMALLGAGLVGLVVSRRRRNG